MRMSGIEKTISDMAVKLPGKVAYYIKDFQDSAVVAHNENLVFNPASTIKLLLLCSAFDAARSGRFDLDDRVVLEEGCKVGGCGVISQLGGGLNPTIRDLMTLMVIISDNTATNLLFDIVGGADRLEAFAQSRGLQDSHLRRKMFDAAAAARGINNTATPSDLAILLEGIERKTLMHPDDCEEALKMLFRQQCNNKLPSKIVDRWEWYAGTNPVKFAHKTGEVEKTEHDAGIMYAPGGNVLVVVMTEGNDNDEAIDFIGNVGRELAIRYRS